MTNEYSTFLRACIDIKTGSPNQSALISTLAWQLNCDINLVKYKTEFSLQLNLSQLNRHAYLVVHLL